MVLVLHLSSTLLVSQYSPSYKVVTVFFLITSSSTIKITLNMLVNWLKSHIWTLQRITFVSKLFKSLTKSRVKQFDQPACWTTCLLTVTIPVKMISSFVILYSRGWVIVFSQFNPYFLSTNKVSWVLVCSITHIHIFITLFHIFITLNL